MAGVRKASVLSITLLVVTLAAGFLGGVAWQRSQVVSAQGEEGGEDQRRDRGDRRMVIDEVGLEPGKRAEVEEIIQHFMVGMRALYAEFEDYRDRMEVLNDEYQQAYRPRQRELYRHALDSIKSILTPEQSALYDSLMAVRYSNRDRSRDESGDGRARGRRSSGDER